MNSSSKVDGPDGLLTRFLKNYSNELANIFPSKLHSFIQKSVLAVWKRRCIIPIPLKYNSTCINNIRPVALTSVAMKTCEHMVVKLLKHMVGKYLDQLQLAYRSKRSIEDAVVYSLEHVEGKKL